MADLRGGYRAQGAVLVFDYCRAIVVQLPSRFKGLEVARNLRGEQTAHVPSEVICVRCDIPKATRSTTFRWIGSPSRLLLVGIFQLGPQPALDIAGAYGLDFT